MITLNGRFRGSDHGCCFSFAPAASISCRQRAGKYQEAPLSTLAYSDLYLLLSQLLDCALQDASEQLLSINWVVNSIEGWPSCNVHTGWIAISPLSSLHTTNMLHENQGFLQT